MKRYILMCSGEFPGYWSGTGITPDVHRAEQFTTKKQATEEWSAHSEAFPGWSATVGLVTF